MSMREKYGYVSIGFNLTAEEAAVVKEKAEALDRSIGYLAKKALLDSMRAIGVPVPRRSRRRATNSKEVAR